MLTPLWIFSFPDELANFVGIRHFQVCEFVFLNHFVWKTPAYQVISSSHFPENSLCLGYVAAIFQFKLHFFLCTVFQLILEFNRSIWEIIAQGKT